MIEIIGSHDKERLGAKLERIRLRKVILDPDLMKEVSSIIDEVRLRGDRALIDYAVRFDGCAMQSAELRIGEDELRQIAAKVDANVLDALCEAIDNVRRFHEHERQESWEIETEHGARAGQRLTPIERVGLYVPGGTASYPSSVVMNVVPAQVAGVKRIAVATPPRSLRENPAVAAALWQLGVSEVYAVGGAQAIAALAYGTETVPRVDKITGPGNRYVAAAKKLVFGTVGIDSIAGPSEIAIIADDTAPAEFLAADLLAQAEHAEDACAILVTPSAQLAHDVAAEVLRQVESLPRRAIVEKSLAEYGAVLLVNDLDEACAIVNGLAPEHLELVTQDDEAVAAGILHAGAIFFGPYTPEVVGDYFAGPNHVLPTAGAARFSSALGVYDFVKRTSVLRYSREALRQSAEKISVLAKAEGLDAHARSAAIRLG
ncbi:MAG TPA: histidinol dehydrogenase [Pyrinomonadaceae bacterium]|nr:histidinol dehydrogenase [Pyrinomonadaceae bacterium]